MKHTSLAIAGLVVALTTGGAALAQQQNQHEHGSSSQSDQSSVMQPQSDHMMQMMQKHLKMKGAMMEGGKMGPEFMNMLDTNSDGKTTSEEARTQLQNILNESDLDGDGSLSISEFEDFHSRLIREKMVDRFQHLDADGSGAITAEEFVSPAENIERNQSKMKKMHSMQE